MGSSIDQPKYGDVYRDTDSEVVMLVAKRSGGEWKVIQLCGIEGAEPSPEYIFSRFISNWEKVE